MSVEFRDLLTDVLTMVDPFRDGITFILTKRTKTGDIVSVAKSKSGDISITSMSRVDVPDLEGAACFGSLPYLKAILSSKFIKGKANFSMEPHYDISSDGKTNSLRFVLFKGGNKMEASYEATDPFISKMQNVKLPSIKDWTVTFKIDQNFISDFTEMHKVHRAAPKIGGDRDDIFTLLCSEGKVIAVFGEKGHQTSMTLGENNESGVKLSALLSVTHFQAILKLLGKGTGEARFAEKALRVDTVTDIATYSLMISTKKQSV